MGTLGHKLFEPFTDSITTMNSMSDDRIFHIKRSGADSKGKLTTEGFVVLESSKIRMDFVPSCPDYVKKERQNNNTIIDENGFLLKDLLFKSPSSSASFVLGGSANGNVEWKTDDGKTLKDIENGDLNCE